MTEVGAGKVESVTVDGSKLIARLSTRFRFEVMFATTADAEKAAGAMLGGQMFLKCNREEIRQEARRLARSTNAPMFKRVPGP